MEDNFEMDPEEIGCDVIGLLWLRKRGQWWSSANTVMNFQVP
jgi:hypothetical protein